MEEIQKETKQLTITAVIILIAINIIIMYQVGVPFTAETLGELTGRMLVVAIIIYFICASYVKYKFLRKAQKHPIGNYTKIIILIIAIATGMVVPGLLYIAIVIGINSILNRKLSKIKHLKRKH